MKKKIISSGIGIILLTWVVDVNAEYTGPVYTSSDISTVEVVKTMKDDVPVVLRGRVIGQLRDEHYLFHDSSGEIDIEIDRHVWLNVDDVDQDTFVTIYGEVEREKGSVSVEVYRIEVNASGKAGGSQ
ncbi:YgiW/YdeI family stress tolerance OB fold protein [Prosthecochloris sp. HL-130-GSB]|jgi:uncharacterized protein (TIGR00156 family)|uniref:NirD/YgiW/YdeI family stress tolerance protein n=1 Tax=Prosthecochloris aestuarii TaxID=1102 RepID=A0A831WPV3_PROAE|nr:NirD/YgiW/YdeI family stress tolerance protein [Prosthecochloris sp. HL-130-GSB]ARM31302.1 hypothetical protein B9H02_08350 [Prosthecochloris sp. HL-130-GSB]HED31898.1 NirD/YgiW/YdeI family stress tolerance protein [Prosthecochloris aestuarii]